MLNKLILTVVGLLAFISASDASEITCVQKTERLCDKGLIRGRIEKGDLNKLLTFVTVNFFPWQFLLISSGGDVDESLAMGRFFKQFSIITEAPEEQPDGSRKLFLNADGTGIRTVCTGPSCVCASACAFAWLGGIRRMGDVGLHRPYFMDAQVNNLPPRQFSAQYNAMLDRVKVYMNEMEVSKRIIDKMLDTSSGSIYWVNWLRDDLDTAPSVNEWLGASCGKLSYKWVPGQPYVPVLTPEHERQMECEVKRIRDQYVKGRKEWLGVLRAAETGQKPLPQSKEDDWVDYQEPHK
jgi:hypothetical protein